jgi:hypothetical protein
VSNEEVRKRNKQPFFFDAPICLRQCNLDRDCLTKERLIAQSTEMSRIQTARYIIKKGGLHYILKIVLDDDDGYGYSYSVMRTQAIYIDVISFPCCPQFAFAFLFFFLC